MSPEMKSEVRPCPQRRPEPARCPLEPWLDPLRFRVLRLVGRVLAMARQCKVLSGCSARNGRGRSRATQRTPDIDPSQRNDKHGGRSQAPLDMRNHGALWSERKRNSA